MTGARATGWSAEQRTALTLQLVPYLIGRGPTTVAEVSAAFDLTSDQVRDVVRALTTVGLPGERGLWQMPNDLFDIDWDLLERDDTIALTHVVGLDHAPRLTAREAAALLAGLQLARSMPGVVDDRTADGLLAKLARGAGARPPEVVVASDPVDEVRRRVQEALRRRVALSFEYRAPGAPATRRTVDPVEVVIADGQWYVRGWCHLRRAMRTFLVDRITEVSVTDIASTHGPESGGRLFDDDVDRTAVLRFHRDVTPLLGGYLDGVEIVSDADMCTARVPVAGANSLNRLVARLGGAVEVVEPADARRAVADWAASALALYDV